VHALKIIGRVNNLSLGLTAISKWAGRGGPAAIGKANQPSHQTSVAVRLLTPLKLNMMPINYILFVLAIVLCQLLLSAQADEEMERINAFKRSYEAHRESRHP
jgi:type VI protein secretion system component VasF